MYYATFLNNARNSHEQEVYLCSQKLWILPARTMVLGQFVSGELTVSTELILTFLVHHHCFSGISLVL